MNPEQNDYTGERFLPEECKGEMAAEHYQRYRFAAALIKGKKVLDAACGEGYGSSLLAESAKEVCGLDISEQTVQRANEKYGRDNLSYHAGSVEKLPFPDHTFDAVVSYETIEHVTGRIQESFLKEIRRVLKPGGLLIMSTPNKAVYTDLVEGENPYHVKEFYVDQFLKFLGGAFQNMEVYCQYPDVGYFISKAGQDLPLYNKEGKHPKDSRYVIGICTDGELPGEIPTDSYTIFEGSMYYQLNRYAHQKEREIRALKKEADAFAAQLEASIQEQQRYIEKLEMDLDALKEKRNPLRRLLKGPIKFFRK